MAMNTKLKLVGGALAAILSMGASTSAWALDWSDNSVSWRWGTRFAEPFNSKNIKKNIFALTHVSGYQYGSNFLNVDVLFSDSNDPKRYGSSDGAQEIYLVYRHTFDLGKISGKDLRFGPVRGFGLTAGFDWNSKLDSGYNSRKQMLVLGPTVKFDVPGFLDVSLLWLDESNRPSASPGAFNPGYPKDRYHYRDHAMLTAAWGIPIGDKWSFEGFGNLIDGKGRDEVGARTAVETNIDMQLMYDAGPSLGLAKKALKVGFEYQYWKNKFGNNHSGPAGKGAFARTPMLRVEYHF